MTLKYAWDFLAVVGALYCLAAGLVCGVLVLKLGVEMIRSSYRELMAQVDLRQAAREWCERNPKKAAAYTDKS